MKRLGFIVVVVIIVFAFIAGYWPQHKKLEETQAKLAATTAQLSTAESTLHLCHLQDQLLSLVQATSNNNYADALNLSTKFFDDLREEAMRTTQPELKSSLLSILDQRDAVTTALAKANPSAHSLLVKLLTDFSKHVKGKNSQETGSTK